MWLKAFRFKKQFKVDTLLTMHIVYSSNRKWIRASLHPVLAMTRKWPVRCHQRGCIYNKMNWKRRKMNAAPHPLYEEQLLLQLPCPTATNPRLPWPPPRRRSSSPCCRIAQRRLATCSTNPTGGMLSLAFFASIRQFPLLSSLYRMLLHEVISISHKPFSSIITQ